MKIRTHIEVLKSGLVMNYLAIFFRECRPGDEGSLRNRLLWVSVAEPSPVDVDFQAQPLLQNDARWIIDRMADDFSF